MNENSIELIKTMYDAFSRRDVPTILQMIDPALIISQTELLPWGGTFNGIEGLQIFFGKLFEYLDSQVEVEEYVDAGERIVAIGRTRGRVKSNNAAFDIRAVHTWTVKDGKALRFEPNIDTPKMLEILSR